jgi:hypothetical protein
MTLDIASLGEGKKRTASSNLDVIRMGCKAHELKGARRQAQFPHCTVDSQAAKNGRRLVNSK